MSYNGSQQHDDGVHGLALCAVIVHRSFRGKVQSRHPERQRQCLEVAASAWHRRELD